MAKTKKRSKLDPGPSGTAARNRPDVAGLDASVRALLGGGGIVAGQPTPNPTPVGLPPSGTPASITHVDPSREEMVAIDAAADALLVEAGIDPNDPDLIGADPRSGRQQSPEFFGGGRLRPGSGASRSFGPNLPPGEVQGAPAPVENRETRYVGSGIQGALEDNVPLDQDNPEDDLMRRLTDAILNPRKDVAVHIPFSRGEMIALGILGGLSNDAFQNIVQPMIQADRLRTERDADRKMAQEQREIAAIESLINLRGVQEQRQENRRAREESLNLQKLAFLSLDAQRDFNKQMGLIAAGQRERALDIQSQRARARLHRPIPAETALKLGGWLEVVGSVDNLRNTYLRDFGGTGGVFGSNVPGGTVESPFGGALTTNARKFRSGLQKVEAEIRNKIFGAAFTATEATKALAFIPDFGDFDTNVAAGINNLRDHAAEKFRGYLNGLRGSGYDTTGLEDLAHRQGLSNEEMGLTGPIGFTELPPGITPLADGRLPPTPQGVEFVGWENDMQLLTGEF